VTLSRRKHHREFIGFFNYSEVIWTGVPCFHVECSVNEMVFNEIWNKRDTLLGKTTAAFDINYVEKRDKRRDFAPRHQIEIQQVTFCFSERETEAVSKELAASVSATSGSSF
jgi:hypothetical protein